MKVNYGYIPPVPKDEDYVFGASRLPTIPVLPDGNWWPFIPLYEPQTLESGEDTHGCTVWGTENGLETYLKHLTGKEWNFSERFLYILMHLRPPGGDPFKVGEAIRNNGVPNHEDLPFTKTFDEFIQPDPLPETLIQKAKLFTDKYDFKHEYVFHGPFINPEEKRRRITAALKCSPLGVSLFAWEIDENGLYYRPEGEPDTHWCLLIKEEADCDIILDSYDHSIKKVRKDMNYGVCIRYYVKEKFATPISTSTSFFTRLLTFLKTLLP